MHKAEASGQKRYLAAPDVAKRIGKTDRHVWKALEFHKGYYRGAITGVGAITQSGYFSRYETVVTIHSQTGTGAVLLPTVLDGTIHLFHVEERGEQYEPGDSLTIADAINGGTGSACSKLAARRFGNKSHTERTGALPFSITL